MTIAEYNPKRPWISFVQILIWWSLFIKRKLAKTCYFLALFYYLLELPIQILPSDIWKHLEEIMVSHSITISNCQIKPKWCFVPIQVNVIFSHTKKGIKMSDFSKSPDQTDDTSEVSSKNSKKRPHFSLHASESLVLFSFYILLSYLNLQQKKFPHFDHQLVMV